VNFPKALSADDPKNIETAALILREGGLVAFPTETVYGLGADAQNEKAVCRIFEVKKRPSFDPLIVHVASPQQAFELWREVPAAAKSLVQAFWPGPLTIVLPKSEIVPDIVTAGLPTVAVRMPKNDIALALIRALGKPIAAPSANFFGYTSPTSATHVLEDMGEKIDLVLDGRETIVGVESTVVKIEDGVCEILRPGGVTLEQISAIVPVKKIKNSAPGKVESPGQLKSHYAPWTPLVLMEKPFSQCLMEIEKYHTRRTGCLAFREKPEISWLESVLVLSSKGDLTEAASNLFQAIRKLDKMNLDLILAEPVPENGLGVAVMDRLRKASAREKDIER
jgi:L-threonylcarbamoyladenylate synthase